MIFHFNTPTKLNVYDNLILDLNFSTLISTYLWGVGGLTLPRNLFLDLANAQAMERSQSSTLAHAMIEVLLRL